MTKYVPFIHKLPKKKKHIQEQLPLLIEEYVQPLLQPEIKDEQPNVIEVIELF